MMMMADSHDTITNGLGELGQRASADPEQGADANAEQRVDAVAGQNASPLPAEETPPLASRFGRVRLLGSMAVLLAVAGLAVVWHRSDLHERFALDALLDWAGHMGSGPAAPLLVMGIYALGGLIAFPATILMAATALVFPPALAFLYSLLGCLASAATVYGVGRITGRGFLRRYAGPRLNRISRQLGRRGVLTMSTIRLFPVGPFSVVNFIAGASHIGFRDFLLGSAIGLSPWIFAITIIGDRLGDSIRNPGAKNLAVFIVISIVFAGLNILVNRRLANEAKPVSEEAGNPRVG